LSMVPELAMMPKLIIVTPDGIVTVLSKGIITISPTAIVVGGPAPPQVAAAFQFPF